MRNWTRRERGMGLGLVLMAVAAIAVPAWAAGDEEAVTEATGDAVDAIPAAVTAERERIDKCMTEHGFGPGSHAGKTFTLPAPEPGSGELTAPPEPDPEFKQAAEDCGLPAPPDAMPLIRAVAKGRGEGLCPLPPPDLRERGADDESGE